MSEVLSHLAIYLVVERNLVGKTVKYICNPSLSFNIGDGHFMGIDVIAINTRDRTGGCIFLPRNSLEEIENISWIISLEIT